MPHALLAKHGLVGSMSRKGNRWDNAVIKRFFLNLMMERVWQRDYASHAEAMSGIADDVVSFYNNVRLQLQTGQLAAQCLRALIDKHATCRGVRNKLKQDSFEVQ